jgi:hypothetical protein
MAGFGHETARRRTFVKGASAVAVGAVGSMYVKPELRSLGVVAAYASSAITVGPPPKPGTGTGYTPGIWSNSGGGGLQSLWTGSLSNPDWLAAHAAGTAVDASNPFYTTESFTPFFNSVATLDGVAYTGVLHNGSTSNVNLLDMLQVSDGGSSDIVQKAGREMVAAYLNAAYLGAPPYPYTEAQLLAMWNNTAADSTTANWTTLFNALLAVNTA